MREENNFYADKKNAFKVIKVENYFINVFVIIFLIFISFLFILVDKN